MREKTLVLLFVSFTLGSCGCYHSPSALDDSVRQFPSVHFNDSRPKPSHYILHFPAGSTVTTTVLFKGSLFEDTAQKPLTLTINRDIYLYKDWVSFDRQRWLKSDQVFDFTLDIRLPSYEQPQVSRIDMSLNVK